MSGLREMNRRAFCRGTLAGAAAVAGGRSILAAEDRFALRYVLASAMYGTAKLSEILPEVAKVGASHIDLWPQPHGNQREQVQEMGIDRFAAMLREHDVQLGVVSCYKPGPFALQSEMELASDIGATGVVLITTGRGPGDATGADLRQAVDRFIEQMKPHLELAEKHDCIIAIENHSRSLVHSPEAVRVFADAVRSQPRLGLAFAPHHLPQNPDLQAQLIRHAGPAIRFFYAQQHGKGATAAQPKEDELLQMPGRGPLDFTPLLAALAEIRFNGLTEIFMHPYPRGEPILDSTDAITAEINRSRSYLQDCIQRMSRNQDS